MLVFMLMAPTLPAQKKADAPQKDFTFKVSTDLVLVNVVARDKKGNLVTDLKREDFTVLEDNKPQQLKNFDLENTELAVLPPEETPSPVGVVEAPAPANSKKAPELAAKADTSLFNNRRRMLHDMLLGTVIINNSDLATVAQPYGSY